MPIDMFSGVGTVGAAGGFPGKKPLDIDVSTLFHILMFLWFCILCIIISILCAYSFLTFLLQLRTIGMPT